MGTENGLFADGAVVRRVNGEAALLLGGGRALLMQLAHPSVAAAVAEHSQFQDDPFGRLRRTLEVVSTVVFGTEEQARRAAAGLAAVHGRIHGAGYDATDPDQLLWVHATLVDTALRVHRRFLGGLSATEEDRYYTESMAVAEVLGVPIASQPPDRAAFRAYVRHMVATLEVTPTAKRLARAVLHPHLPLRADVALAPLAEMARQVSVGLLPEPLRRQYGFAWDGPRQAALVASALASRNTWARLPPAIRRTVA